MKGFALGVGATLGILLLGAYVLIHSGLIPANADATPGKLEYWMAKTSLRATLKREAPKVPDPVPLTATNLIAGIQLYAKNCAICHGTAQGTPAASDIAKGLYQKPPQLATDGVEDDPEGVTFWKVEHGIRLTAMPSFRNSLTSGQIWTLALFLKHMDHLPPSAQKAWEEVKN
ncbi:MAG TPA: cytochrome c [Burkholderiales bacterium]|nr:cytochrome c [Burkholderiales bacterium]